MCVPELYLIASEFTDATVAIWSCALVCGVSLRALEEFRKVTVSGNCDSTGCDWAEAGEANQHARTAGSLAWKRVALGHTSSYLKITVLLLSGTACIFSFLKNTEKAATSVGPTRSFLLLKKLRNLLIYPSVTLISYRGVRSHKSLKLFACTYLCILYRSK